MNGEQALPARILLINSDPICSSLVTQMLYVNALGANKSGGIDRSDMYSASDSTAGLWRLLL
jgi:hypothetical protein